MRVLIGGKVEDEDRTKMATCLMVTAISIGLHRSSDKVPGGLGPGVLLIYLIQVLLNQT